jgi:hypothetical protein
MYDVNPVLTVLHLSVLVLRLRVLFLLNCSVVPQPYLHSVQPVRTIWICPLLVSQPVWTAQLLKTLVNL